MYSYTEYIMHRVHVCTLKLLLRDLCEGYNLQCMY